MTFAVLLLLEKAGNFAADTQKWVGDRHQAYILALLGLAGSLTPVILSWTKDRSTASRQSQLLDEGMKRISFWDQWLKLSSTPGDEEASQARQRVQRELQLLSDSLGTSAAMLHSEVFTFKQMKDTFTSTLSHISGFRRAFLLYAPARTVAWVPRTFFYLFIALTILLIALGIFLIPDWNTLRENLLFSAFTAIASVAFRAFSVSIERPHRPAEVAAVTLPASPPPPGSAA
jgi:hypothetical protein